MSEPKRSLAGVDTGGTFTDVAAYDMAGWHFAKTLTTPRDPRQGIMDGLSRVSGGEFHLLDTVVHGTTLVANAIIERKGSRVGLVTTRGFRDTLEIGTEFRYDLFDLFLDRPPTLVPRGRRIEVAERIRADGSVALALEESAIVAAATSLADLDCDAIAVCLMHSYQNAEHELLLESALTQAIPEADISLSSRVSPQIGEYVRASTTVANAYVRPLVRTYLIDLRMSLRAAGFGGELYLMQSNGAVVTVDVAADTPIHLVESGPAAGAIAAASQGRRAGYTDLISFDMGGTTAKMCVVRDGQPTRTSEFEVARLHRFKRGSGLPVQVSVVDMIEIGAGGGSIAHIDQLGLLQVGPESSGADPGPACYARGGILPTVTDADLVLGYLNPRFFLGGEMNLDASASEKSIAENIGSPLGVDLTEAARGIVDAVNSNMASAMRLHVLERGFEPSRFDLYAFGGAGPVHAYDVARRLGMRRVIVPPGAGVASAIGLLAAPRAIELSRSRYARLSQLNLAQSKDMIAVLNDLEKTATEQLRRMSDLSGMRIMRLAEMRYAGQGHTLSVPLASASPEDFSKEVKDAFDAAYATRYGQGIQESDVEILTLRIWAEETAVRALPPMGDDRAENRWSSSEARFAYFAESGGMTQCNVCRRDALHHGVHIDGPLLIEDWASTIVVGPGGTVKVDNNSNVVIDLRT